MRRRDLKIGAKIKFKDHLVHGTIVKLQRGQTYIDCGIKSTYEPLNLEDPDPNIFCVLYEDDPGLIYRYPVRAVNKFELYTAAHEFGLI